MIGYEYAKQIQILVFLQAVVEDLPRKGIFEG